MRILFLSARGQLFGLWLLLAMSAAATAFLFWQFYSQTAARQVAEGQERAARACRAITDRYHFYTTGWTSTSPQIDDATLHKDLTAVVSSALAESPGIEGGIWRRDTGSLAYAYPTYEGSGPKYDLPIAELPTIQHVNEESLAADEPVNRVQPSRSQTLVVHACDLPGPIIGLSAWTMTRVYTWSGPAYERLRWGLALTAFTVVMATLLLALVLAGWVQRVTRLQTSLGAAESLDLPRLPPTGDIDLDRLVTVLNSTGTRLQEARNEAAAAERLAAVGRLSAGLAHEIRNPLTAMRLKAENALASGDAERARSSLQSILGQIGRLEALLRNLLATTHRKQLLLAPVNLKAHLKARAEGQSELADRKGVKISVLGDAVVTAICDEEEVGRAVDNLLINAIEASPPRGEITLTAEQRGIFAVVRIKDEGNGVDDTVAGRLFEPFVTGRADGTGLGLAIVREIARAHGGEARYLPRETGSEFEIELPCLSS